MARYLFSSHDGFGLGHTRRNSLIAGALLDADQAAEAVILTGVAARPSWALHDRLHIVAVPPLLKDSTGAYRHESLPFEDAIAQRARRFLDTVATFEPTTVVVDRHPFGIAGELRPGLAAARQAGAKVVLGLRDVLDEPGSVRAELAGDGWAAVGRHYDQVLVYGEPWMCDHRVEYGLPTEPVYCGWVVEDVAARWRDRSQVVVAAGGGGDGDDVFRLGIELLGVMSDVRVRLVAGPYGARPCVERLLTDPSAWDRLSILADVPSCAQLVAGAGAVIQMAGYNSTFESLAAGVRPILVPRRSPRREQAIRAARLAAVGLADVVDETSAAEELVWLLRRDRCVGPDELTSAGVRLDGAARAAAVIAGHDRVGAPC